MTILILCISHVIVGVAGTAFGISYINRNTESPEE